MNFTLDQLAFLASAAGERLLNRLAAEDLSDKNTLRLLTALRKEYAADHAGAALELARLRLKAVEKFGDDAARLFFTRSALEQASDPLVRRYRAGAIRDWGASRNLSLVDACCGIGADTLAFALAGIDVLGLDIDPVRVEIARLSAAVLGLPARFEMADVCAGLPPADVVFFDPARRNESGERVYDVERYTPPLSTVRGWPHSRIVGKLSPGVDLAELEEYRGAVEFISVGGDLKEAVLWLGAGEAGKRATLLVGDAVYHWQDRKGEPPVGPYLTTPRDWLIEPDPALIRAGLVQDAAAAFDGCLLDPTIVYFTSDSQPDSPWVRAWRVLDWMPFNLKRLRAYLRERNVGSVTVKKRGSPLTPETLIPQLKLRGDDSRVLALTRLNGQPVVLICAPC